MNSTPTMAFFKTSWTFTDIAQPLQEGGHLQRDGGLAGAGIAREEHVQRRRLGCQPRLAPGLVHQQQGSGFADAGLTGSSPIRVLSTSRSISPRPLSSKDGARSTSVGRGEVSIIFGHGRAFPARGMKRLGGERDDRPVWAVRRKQPFGFAVA